MSREESLKVMRDRVWQLEVERRDLQTQIEDLESDIKGEGWPERVYHIKWYKPDDDIDIFELERGPFDLLERVGTRFYGSRRYTQVQALDAADPILVLGRMLDKRYKIMADTTREIGRLEEILTTIQRGEKPWLKPDEQC